MTKLYHLLQMFFSMLLFLISCIGSLGQFLYPWSRKTEQAQRKTNIEVIHDPGLTQSVTQYFINSNQPEYPKDMAEAQEEGKVILTCDIKMAGKLNHCQVVQSSGQKSFDITALRYVKQALFNQEVKNRLPVKQYARRYTINFNLGH